MINYEYGALFNDDSIKKEIIIKYGSTTITNEDLFNQEMELDESLCSEEQLKFGSCESSVINFRVANVVSPVKGNWISVSIAIDGHTDNPLPIGRYRVESDRPTSDRKWREIVAYDALYDMINDDVSAWYNSVLPNKNTSMTLAMFRQLFLQKYGVEEEIDAPLVNDSMIVTRTIDSDELSGAKVITAICELNGCFGHIGRNGKFKSVQLIQGIKGLYPRNDLYPANDIYPRDPKSTPIGKGIYITCEYEDFTVNTITGVDIYKEENLLGGSAGSAENKYVVEDNFLLYGKSEPELHTIANNMLSAIRGLDYRPFDSECKGNPCFEVGDPVRLSTKYEIVESYILSRTLKGTQALKDSYSAEGTEKYEIKVNSAKRETAQLSGRTEQLERVSEEQQENIENINSDIDVINQDIDNINKGIDDINQDIEDVNADISDIEENVEKVRVSIEKTESSITTTVAGSQKIWDESKYNIEYYGYGAPVATYPPINESSVGKYYLDQTTNTVYHCVKDALGIRWGWPEKYTNQKITYTGNGEPVIGYPPDDDDYAIGKYYLDQDSGKLYRCAKDALGIRWGWPVQLEKITEQLSSRIEQTKDSIQLEVTRAQNAENSLSSRINIEAGNITLEVERAKSAEQSLSSRISLTESSINLKVSKGEVISAINLSPEAVDIDASKINLNGAITANGNFKVKLDGTISSTGGTFTNAYFEDTIYLSRYGNSYPVMSVPSAGYLDIANTYTHTTIKGSAQCDGTFQVGSIYGLNGGLSFGTNPVFSAIGSSGSEANVHVGSGNRLNRITSSARRYKNHILPVTSDELDPHKLYDIPVVQFRFNKNHLSNPEDIRYDRDVIGLIADDVAKYYPVAADYENGMVENWNARYMIPPILKLTQEHKSKLDEHDGLINKIIEKIGGI